MSQDKFFDKFPIINYGNSTANTAVVDITKRVAMLDIVYNDPYVFYPYELSDYERPDQFSDRYYDDSYKSWLLYLSNKIVDPYYEWYLQQNEFDNFIISKYGSVESATQKIKYYANDWANAETISVSRFNALSATLQDYWEPVYGVNSNIMAYTRKQKDWVMNTNSIVSYDFGVLGGGFYRELDFIVGEIVDVVFDNTHSGKGQVLSASQGLLYIQHTSGTVLANTSVPIVIDSYIYGKESKITTNFSSSTLLKTNISPEEYEYWKPVTYYEYETQKNEYNKTIRTLDNRYSAIAVNNLTDLLSNT